MNHMFVHGDICDAPLVERLIDEHRIDAIVISPPRAVSMAGSPGPESSSKPI